MCDRDKAERSRARVATGRRAKKCRTAACWGVCGIVIVCEHPGAQDPGKDLGSPHTITIGPPRPFTDRPFQLDSPPFPRFALGTIGTTPCSITLYIQPNFGAIGVSPPVRTRYRRAYAAPLA